VNRLFASAGFGMFHRIRNRSGAAAVEFALVFPILVVVLLATFEFGRVWNIQQVVTDAAREGSRRAVVKDGLTGAAKQSAVVNSILNRLTPAGLAWNGIPLGNPMNACSTPWAPPTPPASSISVSGCGWGGTTDTPARIVIRTPFPFQFLAPAMNLLSRSHNVGPMLLRSDFSMRNE
jgi:Flp pilus assembly pilin Flp